jgi:exopolysaccharide production protein ExoQ
MPPIVASVLFYTVIAWLMYTQSKGPKVSAALWLATLDFAFAASKPITFWLFGNDYIYTDPSIIEGDPVTRTTLILLFLAGFGVLLRRRIRIGQVIALNPALVVLMLYLALSVLWSHDPFIALKRYFREIGHIIMVLVVLTDVDPIQAIQRVLVRCAYVLIPLSVLYAKYYPGLGRGYNQWTGEVMFTGVTTNKNTLGMLAMLMALFLVWRLLSSPKLLRLANAPDALALVMAAWLLNVANSKTSVACFLVGVLTLLAARTQWIRPRVILVKAAIWIVLIAAGVLFMMPASRGYIAEQLGRDPTLTTRTVIWERALALHTNPIIGAGYNSVWLTEGGRILVNKLSLAHAHNGYLEVYLNTGLIGVFLLLLVLSTTVRNATRILSAGLPLGPLLVTWCVVAVIYNFSEVTFNKDNVVTLGLFLIAIRLDRRTHFINVAAPSQQPAVAGAGQRQVRERPMAHPARFRKPQFAPKPQMTVGRLK